MKPEDITYWDPERLFRQVPLPEWAVRSPEARVTSFRGVGFILCHPDHPPHIADPETGNWREIPIGNLRCDPYFFHQARETWMGNATVKIEFEDEPPTEIPHG